MINTVKHVLSKVKRYFLLIIGLPVLLGALGYFIEVKNEEPGSATSTVSIMLGKYDNPDFNNSENVQLLLTSNHLISEVFNEMNEAEIAQLTQKLNVERINQSTISISYVGENEQLASEVLERFTDNFLLLDNKKFEEKKTHVENQLNTAKSETVSDEAKVEKLRLIYELEDRLVSMDKARIIEPISTTVQTAEGLSPKKRAVLGILIGFTVMAGFIVVPELFRKD